MGEILGIGCTHAPHLQFPDADMANVFRRYLRSDETPAELKDPQRWPEGARREWGGDEGLSAAARHRADLVAGFRAARAALDKFNPDLVLIWGDDQYENFRLDLLTPFCVYALGEILTAPFKASEGLKASANVWGEPSDQLVRLKGHPAAARLLAQQLVQRGFDVACAYRFLHSEVLSHAFTRTVLYLDYDRKGFPYPVVPFHVNCYGSHLRVPKKDIQELGVESFLPPPSPPPWRCYDIGKEIGKIFRDSPWKVALIGSSSWSHASLTQKHHFLYPDLEADRRRLRELQSGALQTWRGLSGDDIRDSGQHELLNWICLAGAMESRKCEVLTYAETHIFNSTKTIALFL
jgi:hypothetical protein